jgi:regulator of protease activity HflC (stomatin/prohibitin superfamily)
MQWKDVPSKVGAGARGMAGATGRALSFVASDRAARRTLLLLLLVVALGWFVEEGLVRVRESDVGVVVDNVSGKFEVADAAGFRFVVPVFQSFFRLDRKIQSLVMAEAPEVGFRGNDAVRIKTKDGSDVSIDLLVNYHLLAGGADKILHDSGQGMAFADLWVRSSVRAMVARAFGQLSTEQIYDASQRDLKAKEMLTELNAELARHHVEVVAVVPREVRFFAAYEDVIKQKKIKDQETQAFKSEANLQQQQQVTQVAQAGFEANQLVKKAVKDAEVIIAEGEAYAARVRLEADGELAKALRDADGQLAIGLAEAQGIKEQAAALSGGGGVNLVALAYARKLSTISFSGVPVMQDGVQGNFRVQQLPAPQLSSPQSDATPPVTPQAPPTQGPELPPGMRRPPAGPAGRPNPAFPPTPGAPAGAPGPGGPIGGPSSGDGR